ncbi:TonB-dependent receptor [Sphingomonas oligophenolica]|uniref:TonB-dependent receptor n=1 Tax=Sphingomonas oligophenolica TaxID=301154 RepID=A0ABU9XWV9_9SPHN
MNIRKARIAARSGVALLALVWAGVVSAQETSTPADQTAAASGPTTTTDEDVAGKDVVVTGSRIRGAAPVGSSVIAIDRKAIEASGAVTTDRLIKEIPQVFDLGTSENSRGQSGGSNNISFGNAINIRGIGPYATLTILDGHRAVDNSRSVDPSIVPSLGLERVEVVADGASAVYGSDAVAGVVNLIPRRSLNGIEAMARGGLARDFYEEQYGIAAGKTGDWGQVMVAYEHVYRSNLSGDKRDFFRSNQTGSGGHDYRTTLCDPGTITVGGVTYPIPAGGVSAANAGTLAAGPANKCEGFTGQDLIPETKYDSVNATATVHIADWLDFVADGYWSKRSFAHLNGYSGTTVTVPTTNAFFVRPTGTVGAETVSVRFDDLPNNLSTGFTRTWEATGGLRAKLGGWQLTGQVSYGRGHDESDTYHGLNTPALNAALASSNPATAFDPYGLHRTSPAVLAAINDQIFLAPTLTRLTDATASINGTLFTLPGGGVKLAAGYERYEEEVALGTARGGPTTPTTYRNFSRQVDSAYAELLVPVFGAGNATPGLERLELSAAVRYDNYSDVGHTTNPKFGINWSPVQHLMLRGSYGTSFRAPLFSQIYGNSSNFFIQPYADPTAGGAIVQGVALSGGNLALKPETAKTWSVGADWDPVPGARFSITYWNVDYKGQVNTYLADLAILSKESQLAGTGVILRGAAAAARVAQLTAAGITVARGVMPNPVTLFVDGRTQNLDRSLTSGLDFVATYGFETGRMGHLTLNANATYILSYKTALSSGATPTDKLNTIFNPLRFKGRAGIFWDPSQVISGRLVVNYVNGYDNNTLPAGAVQHVGAYTTADLGVTFNIGGSSDDPLAKGLSLSLDVLNAFDKDPPYVDFAPTVNGSGGYDATAANPVGREFAVTLRKKF